MSPWRLALLLVFALPALADEAPTPAPTQDPTLAAFAVQNPTCLEWTDACSVCKRDDAGAAHCSTPGIACQPQALACSKAKAP